MCNMRKRGIRVGVLVLKCLPQIFYPVILGTLTWRWPRSTLATSHELKFIAPKYFLHNLLWRQKGRGRQKDGWRQPGKSQKAVGARRQGRMRWVLLAAGDPGEIGSREKAQALPSKPKLCLADSTSMTKSKELGWWAGDGVSSCLPNTLSLWLVHTMLVPNYPEPLQCQNCSLEDFAFRELQALFL